MLGKSSPPKDLPSFLCKPIPHSIATLFQESNTKIQRIWTWCWRESPWYHNIHKINKSLPLKNWISLIKPLNRKQASILMQLCTGQTGLNKYLHWIQCSITPICHNCDENTNETIHHFLFDCSHYHREWAILSNKLHWWSHDLTYLLSHPAAIPLLHCYIQATGQFKKTFGNHLPEDQPSV